MSRKLFSQDPKGIAHAFLRHRAKPYFQSQAKDIKVEPTIYVLSGMTKEKLMIVLKGNFRHFIIVNEGNFSINFPYEK